MTSSSLWDTKTKLVPWSRSLRTCLNRKLVSSRDSTAVGSSMKTTRASRLIALAISTICLSAMESVLIIAFSSTCEPSRSRTRARLGAHVLAVEHAETGDFAAEKQALGDGQMFGEIEFLVDDDDAERLGGAIRRQLDRLAVEQDLAGGRLLEAGENLDERGLAGTVLAHERMDFAGAKIEIDAEEHLHAAEGLADSPRGQHHRAGVDGLRTHHFLPAAPIRLHGM